MSVKFPGESEEYRTARDRLLASEIELRRQMEAVAAERRELPPGGEVPEDYIFRGEGPDGDPLDVRLSELFAPGKHSLAIYSFMFLRDGRTTGPGPSGRRRPRSCLSPRDRARPASASLTSSMGWSSTPASR